jgi:hypothetical protein
MDVSGVAIVRLLSHAPPCGRATDTQWLGRTRVALTSHAGAESLRWICPHRTHCMYLFWAQLCFVWTLIQDCVSKWQSHKGVSQPPVEIDTLGPQSLSPSHVVSCVEKFRMSRCQLLVWPVSGPRESTHLSQKLPFVRWLWTICQQVHFAFVLLSHCCHVTACPS